MQNFRTNSFLYVLRHVSSAISREMDTDVLFMSRKEEISLVVDSKLDPYTSRCAPRIRRLCTSEYLGAIDVVEERRNETIRGERVACDVAVSVDEDSRVDRRGLVSSIADRIAGSRIN